MYVPNVWLDLLSISGAFLLTSEHRNIAWASMRHQILKIKERKTVAITQNSHRIKPWCQLLKTNENLQPFTPWISARQLQHFLHANATKQEILRLLEYHGIILTSRTYLQLILRTQILHAGCLATCLVPQQQKMDREKI